MPKKTLEEIMAESASAVGPISNYYATLSALKAQRKPNMGGFEDRLSPAEAERIRKEQAHETARLARKRALEEYKAALEANHERVNAWKREAELFGVEDSNALATAAVVDEEGLRRLIDTAAMSGNKEVGRAAFVAANSRGLGDIINEYFAKVAPEARDLWEDYQRVPSREDMQRQLENADRLVPQPTEADVTPEGRAA